METFLKVAIEKAISEYLLTSNYIHSCTVAHIYKYNSNYKNCMLHIIIAQRQKGELMQNMNTITYNKFNISLI